MFRDRLQLRNRSQASDSLPRLTKLLTYMEGAYMHREGSVFGKVGDLYLVERIHKSDLERCEVLQTNLQTNNPLGCLNESN